jgi:hypothetical protein
MLPLHMREALTTVMLAMLSLLPALVAGLAHR